MIKAIYVLNNESAIEQDIEKIKSVIEQKPKIIWIDICIQNDEFENEELELLTQTFKFHELSIEDCLIPQYHPKIEEFENYVFVAIHGIKIKTVDFADFEDNIYEMDFFIQKDVIVTVHTEELGFIESMFEIAKIKPHVELKSYEILLYNIFMKILNSYEYCLDRVSDKLDKIEDLAVENPTNEGMKEMLSLKKILLSMRKISEPQKSIFSFFARETSGFISKKATAYFRDLIFQYDRISQSISSYNQIISSVMEVYVSSVTLKLNEIMKFLTVIATILMPAVLITSYFGMNVSFPEHKIFGVDFVWYFVFVVILLSTLGMYLYLKRKKWL